MISLACSERDSTSVGEAMTPFRLRVAATSRSDRALGAAPWQRDCLTLAAKDAPAFVRPDRGARLAHKDALSCPFLTHQRHSPVVKSLSPLTCKVAPSLAAA
ncbi:hypothetical protein OPT61_g10037 [Boeremia exigua]|uniref:Uncharacterized protein n=1 Tax=Boeremia exigua TaxID=749465 RepID=A0ACC2HRH6_9PLEO|nr:hypothetical protein OPT61_g10037 [Boeremia exigua]